MTVKALVLEEGRVEDLVPIAALGVLVAFVARSYPALSRNAERLDLILAIVCDLFEVMDSGRWAVDRILLRCAVIDAQGRIILL